MQTKDNPRAPYIQSLDRGLEILQLVGRSKRSISIAELADLLGIDRSSAFRFAVTLRRRGFLSCQPGKKDFLLGPSMWALAREYDWSKLLVDIAHPDLSLLATQINETAHLAVREGKSVLFIDSAHASRVIAAVGRTGELHPLHCTAHGKAILADADEGELRALLGLSPLRKYTKNTITTIGALAENCAAIQEMGYAIDDSEHAEDLRCIAAPIRFNNHVIGSIGISAPVSRLPDSLYSEYGEKVCVIANKIGGLLRNSE
ncbi:IclR family transcriptional regulator [Paracidobacterium acidisoli]|uniref:IclR family transcriptional regulator n=1 Tax=Paracidobacterium acidisoli TaxID=2303751 RepID=A0A372IMC1_9BACT|nr:IclR family transcriptional regulator [Paracidobacterium acidisoli]MBT9332324.1 IclR family transcriptional regulator [Paracidobacterium acidisoli]